MASVDECEPCAKGHWCSGGAAIACGLGSYSDVLGADDKSACTQCPAKATTTADARTDVTDCVCVAGHYASEREGQLFCETCPANSNAPEASTSISSCLCAAGFDDAQPNASAVDCLQCGVGTMCETEGITVETLPLLPGYYRTGPVSADLRRCPDANMVDEPGCVGGVGGEGPCKAWLTVSERRQTRNGALC